MDNNENQFATEKMWRIPDVAKQLGVSRALIYSTIREGEMRAIRVGRAVRVPASALQEFVERHTIGGTTDSEVGMGDAG